MSEEPKVEGRSITEELGKLGKQMADAIKAAWESEDRRKLQAEILDGLQKFGDEVTVALDKAGKSETAQDLRVKAEKVAVDVRASAVAEDVRKGIISGLDVLNAEMSKLVEKLEPKPAPSQMRLRSNPKRLPNPQRPNRRLPRKRSERTTERANHRDTESTEFCFSVFSASRYCPPPYLSKKSQVVLAISWRVGLEMPHSSQVGR